MKKIYSLILASTLLIFSGCEFKDPTDLIDININYDILDTYIGVNLLDASTGAPISAPEGKYITAKLAGIDYEDIIEPSGSYNDEYQSELGVFSLAVNPSREVSEGNPVEFTMTFSLEGYKTTTKSISISDTGFVSVDVQMLNLSTPPKGVSVNTYSAVASANNGVLQEDISIASESSFDVIIPKNTVVKDKDGNPLSGKLSMELVVYNAESDEAMSLMPGGDGMMATAINADGETEEITFESAGFFDIGITDENGNEGTNFSDGGVQISYAANSEQINSETGETVKAGDTIGVWSFNEETQVWAYEQSATFVDRDGELKIETEIKHFSSWNFDWHYPGKCYTGGTFVFTTSDASLNNKFMGFRGTMYNATTGSYIRYFSLGGYGNQTIQVRNVPNMDIKLDFTSSFYPQHEVPNDIENVNLCTANNKEIPVTAKEVTKTKITIVGDCDGTNGATVQIKPSFYFYYYDLTNYRYNWAYVQNGEVTLYGLEEGHDYQISVYFRGWQYYNITYDGTESYNFNLDLPSDICNSLAF